MRLPAVSQFWEPAGLVKHGFRASGPKLDKGRKNQQTKLFVIENGPFGTPFLAPKIRPRKFMWVPFLPSFPGNQAQIFFRGPENGGFGWGAKSLRWTSLCAFTVLYIYRKKIAPEIGLEIGLAWKIGKKRGKIRIFAGLWAIYFPLFSAGPISGPISRTIFSYFGPEARNLYFTRSAGSQSQFASHLLWWLGSQGCSPL